MSHDDLLCPHCHQVDPRAVAAMLHQAQTPQTGPAEIAVSVDRAAELVGVSRTTLTEWIKRGVVPTVQIGRAGRRLVMVRDLEQALAAHSTRGGTTCQDEPAMIPQAKRAGRPLKAMTGGKR